MMNRKSEQCKATDWMSWTLNFVSSLMACGKGDSDLTRQLYLEADLFRRATRA